MQCAAMDQFSYAEVEVAKRALTIDLLDSATAGPRHRRQRDPGGAALRADRDPGSRAPLGPSLA